jgi:hypothetical protein
VTRWLALAAALLLPLGALAQTNYWVGTNGALFVQHDSWSDATKPPTNSGSTGVTFMFDSSVGSNTNYRQTFAGTIYYQSIVWQTNYTATGTWTAHLSHGNTSAITNAPFVRFDGGTHTLSGSAFLRAVCQPSHSGPVFVIGDGAVVSNSTLGASGLNIFLSTVYGVTNTFDVSALLGRMTNLRLTVNGPNAATSPITVLAQNVTNQTAALLVGVSAAPIIDLVVSNSVLAGVGGTGRIRYWIYDSVYTNRPTQELYPAGSLYVTNSHIAAGRVLGVGVGATFSGDVTVLDSIVELSTYPQTWTVGGSSTFTGSEFRFVAGNNVWTPPSGIIPTVLVSIGNTYLNQVAAGSFGQLVISNTSTVGYRPLATTTCGTITVMSGGALTASNSSIYATNIVSTGTVTPQTSTIYLLGGTSNLTNYHSLVPVGSTTLTNAAISIAGTLSSQQGASVNAAGGTLTLSNAGTIDGQLRNATVTGAVLQVNQADTSSGSYNEVERE